MPETDDKFRQEARVFVKDIISRAFPDHVVAIKSVNVDVASEYVEAHEARIRIEAAAEKEREMMHQINAATQKVIRLSSGEYVNAAAWIDAMEKESKAEALREAAERAIDFYDQCGFGDKTLSRTNLRAAILADEPQSLCTWSEATEGYWSTSCGRSWTFIEGGPRENGICYCHGCGKPVRIADEPNKEE